MREALMRGGRVLAVVLGLVFLAVALASAVGQAQRELQTLERGQPPVLSEQWGRDRKAEIEQCKAAGGIPVVIAGVVASEGIGCAQPLGM